MNLTLHFHLVLSGYLLLNTLSGCVPPIETSAASCPCAEGWRCCGNNVCAKIGEPCPAYCGDGVEDPGEFCDDGETNSDSYNLLPTCNSTCTSYGPHCGDNRIQQKGAKDGSYEGCDPGSLSSPAEAIACSQLHPQLGEGEATCNSNCVSYDTDDCENEVQSYVPSGPFMMGCNVDRDSDCNPHAPLTQETAEFPLHEVFVDAFIIDKNEVTAADYHKCIEAGGCVYDGTTTESNRTYDNNYEEHPINFVTWDQAQAYCQWKNMRLPTEAEWEKAARGTDGRIYPWGDELANCQYAIITNHAGEGCGVGGPWEVGSKSRGISPYGGFDMAGNLFEWVADWFSADYYQSSPRDNPQGPETGTSHTIRGGSWYNADYRLLRSSYRLHFPANTHVAIVGFRCAKPQE